MGMRENFGQAIDFVGAIVASGNPKLFLDGGPTYTEFILETDLTVSEIPKFMVEVDGDKRIELTGQQMLDREIYEGRTATALYFRFSFADPLARTFGGSQLTGLVTQPGQRVLVSVELSAGVTGSEYLRLYTETTPNRQEQFRLYVLPEAVPVSQTGENTFDGFRRGAVPGQNFIRRIHNYGAITKFSLEQDRRTIYGKRELSIAANNARLVANGKTLITSSTCYTVDPIVKGNIEKDMLDTFSVESLRATYTTSSGADIIALTEYVQDMAAGATK